MASQDPTHPDESKQTSSTNEEIAPIIIVEEEDPSPGVVHSQVDKQAAACSLQSLSTFKIPKKPKPVKAKPAVDADDTDEQKPDEQENHKRGAAHEPVSITQKWFGAKEIKAGGSAADASGGTKLMSRRGAKQHMINTGEWYDNMNNLTPVMGEIPCVHSFLTRDECKEVQAVCQAYCTDRLGNVWKRKELERCTSAVLTDNSRYCKTVNVNKPLNIWIQNQVCRLYSAVEGFVLVELHQGFQDIALPG